MGLDVIFKSLEPTHGASDSTGQYMGSLACAETTEAQLLPAHLFIEAACGDLASERGRNSRAQTPASRAHTPMTVRNPFSLQSPSNSMQGTTDHGTKGYLDPFNMFYIFMSLLCSIFAKLNKGTYAGLDLPPSPCDTEPRIASSFTRRFPIRRGCETAF